MNKIRLLASLLLAIFFTFSCTDVSRIDPDPISSSAVSPSSSSEPEQSSSSANGSSSSTEEAIQSSSSEEPQLSSSSEASSSSSVGTNDNSSSSGDISSSSVVQSSSSSEPSTAECGEEEYNPSTHFCYNFHGEFYVIPGCSGKNEYDPATQYCSNGSVKNKMTFIDERDSQEYKYVKIGEQYWMAENLNYLANNSAKCYYYEDDNCDKYGKLYDWATAMNISVECNTKTITDCEEIVNSPHQGVCPNGWHLPTNTEWDILTNFVKNNIGFALRAEFSWNDYTSGSGINTTTHAGNGTNNYGFSALPGGESGSSGNFHYIDFRGYWWAATQYNATIAYSKQMSNFTTIFSTNNSLSNSSKHFLYSVRCVKDPDPQD